MSLCENFSELVRELRSAAGTVLSIVGSRLEATERARVDEVGPQWLNEFEAENDGMECTCGPCPLRDEDVCDEAEAGEYAEFSFGVVPIICSEFPCSPGCASWGCEVVEYQSSAADAAADPSPTVGDEGPEGASAIPPAAPPERSTDPGEVAAPSPGEQVDEDDLAAHIMGDFVSGQEVDPLTATLIDAISSLITRALLADFNITRK